MFSMQAKTVEYGHFPPHTHESAIATIRILDAAETIHAMLEAHEFEPTYSWANLEHWIRHESGFVDSPWTPDHQVPNPSQFITKIHHYKVGDLH